MSITDVMPLQILVLAAGKGTRMKSGRAKVLHEVFFAPMINHVVEAVLPLDAAAVTIVTGHQRESVEKALAGYPVRCAEQKEQLGTGHAVLAAEPFLNRTDGVVMILCGDTPLVRTQTLAAMAREHATTNAHLTVMTTKVADPTNYGRIITDEKGAIARVVEEKDADPEIRRIDEINAGIYLVQSAILFPALREVGTANAQGEIYLTDIVEIAIARGLKVNRFFCPCADEILGVNSRLELAKAHGLLQTWRNLELMAGGVTLVHPETTWIAKGVTIGADTIVHAGVHILGTTIIGTSCHIGPGAIIEGCSLGNGVRIGPYAHLVDVTVESGESIPSHKVVAGKRGCL